jgi:hypothetical protein
MGAALFVLLLTRNNHALQRPVNSFEAATNAARFYPALRACMRAGA